jgi:hypothetical protein
LAGEEELSAARLLAAEADRVHYSKDGELWRQFLRGMTGGKLGRRPWRRSTMLVQTGWQDTTSSNRPGWRQRAAILDGAEVFAVDYEICGRCRMGWVEDPYTDPSCQRSGLARAGLAAVRAKYPGLEWHTLGGHFVEAQAFWTVAAVPGGYIRRKVCPHITIGG